ncbi:MAG: alpha/beta hydrolase [Cyclobacteriaceae bacterium]
MTDTKSFWVSVLLILSVVVSHGQVPDNFKKDGGSEFPSELIYKVVGEDSLKMVFHYPDNFKSSKRYPTIIFFFGGGWNGGSIAQFENQAKYLAQRGMIAVLADYRVKKRQGTTPFEAVQDAKTAVRFLRKNAKKLNIKEKKIVGAGGSAGGHLAAATATIQGLNEPGEDTSISSVPNALVLFNPVIDNGPGGYGYERIGDRYEEISPLHNIRKGMPPTIVFQGTADHLIPVTTAELFKEKMEAVGSRSELFLYEGQKHGFFNKNKSEEHYHLTLKETERFLESIKYIKKTEGRK